MPPFRPTKGPDDHPMRRRELSLVLHRNSRVLYSYSTVLLLLAIGRGIRQNVLFIQRCVLIVGTVCSCVAKPHPVECPNASASARIKAIVNETCTSEFVLSFYAHQSRLIHFKCVNSELVYEWSQFKVRNQ